MTFLKDWNKNEPLALARFVPPDLAEWQVALPASPIDLQNDAQGRRSLVNAIYDALAATGIQYATEAPNPDPNLQTVRGAKEIFGDPRRGTCLDLAALFAAHCLGVYLLPVIVITNTHAFVLVSLEVGSDEIDSYHRSQGGVFTSGAVEDGQLLAELVDSEAYVAVEVTGFAHVTSLPEESLLGEGRRDGLMPFEQACAVARRRFDLSDDPVQFAVDIPWAHSIGFVPQRVYLDDPLPAGSYMVARTEHGVRLDRVAPGEWGARRAQAPIPQTTIIGRTKEKRVLGRISGGELVGLYGEQAMGKSALLRWLGNETPRDLTDANVFLRYQGGGALDVVQEVFERCYDSTRQLSLADAGLALGPLAGRLLLDDIDGMPATEVESVRDILARWGLAVTAVDPSAKSLGLMKKMSALEPAEALELFELKAGPATESERAELLHAFTVTTPAPGVIVDLANDVATEDLSVQGFMDALSTNATTAATTTELGDVGAIIRAAQPSYVPFDAIHATVANPSRAETALEIGVLRRNQLVRQGSPRYRWIGGSGSASVDAEQQLVASVVSWVERQATPDRIVAERGVVLRAAAIAEKNGDYASVMRLARLADGPISAGRRWGAWQELLGRAARAADALQDRSAQAWSRHQLGSRAMGLGNVATARENLRWAVATRRSLGEQAAADVSQHNLSLLPPPSPDTNDDDPDPDPHDSDPTDTDPTDPGPEATRGWLRSHPWASAGLVTAAIVILVAIFGGGDDDPVVVPSDPTPAPTAVVESAPTPTPSPTPEIDLPAVPTSFECTMSDASVVAGATVSAAVIVEPSSLSLTIVFEDELGTKVRADSQGQGQFSYSNEGSYDLSATWLADGQTGTVPCGTVVVEGGNTSDEPTNIECEREPAGQLDVDENFLLTVTYSPADLDLEISFQHGDGYEEPADDQNRSGGRYLAAGEYQPSATWSNGSGTERILCGGVVQVIAKRTVPPIEATCSVARLEPTPADQPNETLELTTDERFLISTDYGPSGLQAQVEIHHGDGFSEPADGQGEATGFFANAGIYTPEATFTTANQVETIGCGTIRVDTIVDPPESFECQADQSQVLVGQVVNLNAFYEPQELDLEIEFKAAESAEFESDSVVTYESAGVFAPLARLVSSDGPGQIVSCGQVTVESESQPVACIDFENLGLSRRFDSTKPSVTFESELDTAVTIAPLAEADAEIPLSWWAQVLTTSFNNGPGQKLWLVRSTATIGLPVNDDGWTLRFRQTAGPVTLVINNAQEATPYPSFGTLAEGGLGGFTIVTGGASTGANDELSILGPGITSIRIGGGQLAIDEICPVAAS